MRDIVAAIEEAVPGARGSISFDPAALPHPSEVDDSQLSTDIPGIRWRSLADGVRDSVELFRRAAAAGRIDVERALAR